MDKLEHSEGDTSKKRARETEDDDADLEGLTPVELAKMSRSERKRHREKKRRSDVNKGFDELMTLLLEIDPTVRAEAEERARRGQWKGNFGAQEDNLLNRVDLISRAVEVLRRIHRENEERKHIIASLTRSGAGSNLGFGSSGVAASASAGGIGGSERRDRAAAASDDVAMMVPGFSSTNSDAFALRAAAESNRFYSQALSNQLSNARSSAGLLSNAPREMLGLSGSLNLRPPYDLLGFTGGAHLAASGGVNEAHLAGNASLFASGLASPGNPNLMNAGVGSSALTRHYLQLLQDRQDAANFAQLTGARQQGDASSQYPGSSNERHGYNEGSRKY